MHKSALLIRSVLGVRGRTREREVVDFDARRGSGLAYSVRQLRARTKEREANASSARRGRNLVVRVHTDQPKEVWVCLVLSEQRARRVAPSRYSLE